MKTTTVKMPVGPRRHQKAINRELKRWNVVVCHRRFGKTVWAILRLLRKCLTSKKDKPRYGYVAPFLKQSKAIAWDYLVQYSRPIPGIIINQSELRIDYPNGGRIRLFGADNPDSIRGIYLDGVVMDEYAQISPSLFGEVLRPALSDRKGWAVWMGTPQGRNHFWELAEHAKKDPEWSYQEFRASDTGIIDEVELADARKIMTQDQYDQEYECSWSAAIRGAYYSDEMRRAREEGRVCQVPIAPQLPVHTAWDLGFGNSTSIVFFQATRMEIRIVDYYEKDGEGLSHFMAALKDKGYMYGIHHLPHDVEVTELQTGRTRRQALEEGGVVPIKVVPRITKVDAGIELVRQMLPRCWFDEERCEYLIRCLESYRAEYDEKHQVLRSTPLHDWTSDAADAFRQIAQGYTEPRARRVNRARVTAAGWT